MIRRIHITHDGHDFRIPSPEGGEAGAYYTDSREDMRDTARVMYNNPRLKFRLHEVTDHPEY